MNTKEMRAKSPEDLNKELLELRKAQFSLRMQGATVQLSKTHETRRVRREIIRVHSPERASFWAVPTMIHIFRWSASGRRPPSSAAWVPRSRNASIRDRPMA